MLMLFKQMRHSLHRKRTLVCAVALLVGACLSLFALFANERPKEVLVNPVLVHRELQSTASKDLERSSAKVWEQPEVADFSRWTISAVPQTLAVDTVSPTPSTSLRGSRSLNSSFGYAEHALANIPDLPSWQPSGAEAIAALNALLLCANSSLMTFAESTNVTPEDQIQGLKDQCARLGAMTWDLVEAGIAAAVASSDQDVKIELITILNSLANGDPEVRNEALQRAGTRPAALSEIIALAAVSEIASEREIAADSYRAGWLIERNEVVARSIENGLPLGY